RQGLGQRDKLATPAVDGAEVVSERIGHPVCHLPPVPAEAREIQLMKQGRVEQGGALAAETTDHLGRWRSDIERLELLGHRIEAIEGRTVVVLVLTLDQAR